LYPGQNAAKEVNFLLLESGAIKDATDPSKNGFFMFGGMQKLDLLQKRLEMAIKRFHGRTGGPALIQRDFLRRHARLISDKKLIRDYL
jgi:hypothetical protein